MKNATCANSSISFARLRDERQGQTDGRTRCGGWLVSKEGFGTGGGYFPKHSANRLVRENQTRVLTA